MCPLRFVLVFFSAVLAGYVAWRMVRLSSHIDSSGNAVSENSGKMVTNDKPELCSKRNGFWGSWRYWWRNFKELKNEEKVSSY